MKLIENNWWLSKQVRYKGNLLIVPVWTNWIAVDADGSIGVCENKPVNGEDFWDSILYVGKVEFEESESWEESLAYVGEEQ